MKLINTIKPSFRIALLTIVILGQTYSTTLGEEMPAQVKQLVEKRQEAISKIDQIFIKELEKIKTLYTKAGDLENANLVNELIKQASNSQSKKEPENANLSFVGKWYVNASGGKFTRELRDNGLCYEDGKKVGSWNHTETQLIILSESGITSIFSLPIKDGKLTGISSKESKEWAVTMQKIDRIP